MSEKIDRMSAEVPPETPPKKKPSAQSAPPTLSAAFTILCQAIEGAAEAHEDTATYLRAQEIQRWYADGNEAIAWKTAVVLLEGMLNIPLRES